jgi:hypothetical protein
MNQLSDQQIDKVWNSLDGQAIIKGLSHNLWNAALRRAFARALQVKLPAVESDARELLREAADLIEYAAYHDGRYDQMAGVNWQSEAQKLVQRMAVALDRQPYESLK